MTLPANAPSWISDAMNRLLESATLTGAPLNMTSAGFCYPRAVMGTDYGNLIILEADHVSVERHTSGGTYLSGVINGVLAVPAGATFDAGKTEALMVQVAQDVTGLLTDGLFFKSMRIGRCGVPGPGFFAAQDAGQPESAPAYNTLPFTIEWGDG